MNYAAHYKRLIDRARGRVLENYRERHHVIPRCMGGGNEPENIVELTAEEHYVAHQLLVKMHANVKGLAIAAIRMARQCTGNKAYGWLRRRHSVIQSVISRGNQYMLGKRHSPEARAKMSASGRIKEFSVAHRAKISAALLGRKQSSETIAKRVATRRAGPKPKGHPQSPANKAAILKAILGVPKTPEHRAKLAAASKDNKNCLGRIYSATTHAWMATRPRMANGSFMPGTMVKRQTI